MRKNFLLILILIAATSLANAQQLPPAEVKALLEKIRGHRASAPHILSDFREEKRMRLMNKPIVTLGKIWFEAPGKFRRDVQGNAPSLTVSNGHDLWIYYPNFKSAEHYTLGKRSPIDAAIAAVNTALNMENIENTFEVTASKISDGYQLELKPRSATMKRTFQKFDIRINNDFIVEQTDILQPNGDQVVTSYSNQSRAPIPASTFDFTPPAGTEITTPLGR